MTGVNYMVSDTELHLLRPFPVECHSIRLPKQKRNEDQAGLLEVENTSDLRVERGEHGHPVQRRDSSVVDTMRGNRSHWQVEEPGTHPGCHSARRLPH